MSRHVAYSDEFVVEDLGIQEVDVYDIEVENDHNFFGNDICVHNSTYLNVQPFVDKYCQGMDTDKIVTFIDAMCKQKLEPYIESSYKQLADYMHAYDQKMMMKRECIGDRAIWTGKKHYILNVYSMEKIRYQQPILKMQGIEAIRTSTPQICRDAIKRALSVIMTGNQQDLITFIDMFRQEFNQMSFEQVAFPRGVNDIDKWADMTTIWKKATPVHVKGALIYNHLLKSKNLENKYPQINQGEKIKFVYCKQPNPYRISVISCPEILPPEFDLERYLDKSKQFDTAFLEPIKTIASAIGWRVEHKQTLELFFA